MPNPYVVASSGALEDWGSVLRNHAKVAICDEDTSLSARQALVRAFSDIQRGESGDPFCGGAG